MNATQDCSSNEALDIVVHVDELLDDQSRHRIEYYLLKATGVVHVQFDRFRQQLLIIGYDPAQTNSSIILRHFKKQQLNAKLIVGI